MSAARALPGTLGVIAVIAVAGFHDAGADGQVRTLDLKGKHLELIKHPALRTVTLSSLPDTAFRIRTWPGLQISRLPATAAGGLASADATAYVAKTWFRSGGSANDACADRSSSGSDLIDLRAPRRHGYTPLAITITPLPPPPRFAPVTWRLPAMPFNDAVGNATADPAQAHEVAIMVPRYSQYVRQARLARCFTGYRVRISLRGPANVDPFTGRAFAPTHVN